jgi:hypothetical protein
MVNGSCEVKIKNLFWKLFWLMLRGKGNTPILFDSEAVCFKAHMIEVDSAYFNPDKGSGLGDYLSLHWDTQVDQYVRIKGDIDDIQAIIKHVNDQDEFVAKENKPYEFKYTNLTPEEYNKLMEMRIPQKDNDGD